MATPDDVTYPANMSQTDKRNRAAHQTGKTKEEMADYYSKWARTYDEDLSNVIYNGPKIVASTVGSLYINKRDQVIILDIACGTGLLGKELYELGFRKLDGLDPASGMLEKCRTNGIYDRLICDYIGETNPVDVQTDTYDCVVISGGLGENHIPRTAFREMARVVKPGGYVCFVMRREYTDYVTAYNDNKLEEELAGMEKEGVWQSVIKKIFPEYSFGKDGILFLFKVTSIK